MSDARIQEARPAEIEPGEILAVRRGPGANCSSIGSVLDMIFLSATIGGALLVAVAASLGDGPAPPSARDTDDAKDDEDARPR